MPCCKHLNTNLRTNNVSFSNVDRDGRMLLQYLSRFVVFVETHARVGHMLPTYGGELFPQILHFAAELSLLRIHIFQLRCIHTHIWRVFYVMLSWNEHSVTGVGAPSIILQFNPRPCYRYLISFEKQARQISPLASIQYGVESGDVYLYIDLFVLEQSCQ